MNYYLLLYRMEKDQAEESIQALRNLVLLVGTLATCGFIELKPGTAASSGSLFKLPGFNIPQPAGKGNCFVDSHHIEYGCYDKGYLE